jgi:hypothetical protein
MDRKEESVAARTLNVLLGIWLFISAFAWRHSTAQMTDTWILGVLCVVIALVAMRIEQVRFVNAALAVCLFISAFALRPHSTGTMWNNALVAIAIFIISLTPSESAQLPGRRPHAARS